MKEPFVISSYKGEVLLNLEGLFLVVRLFPPLPEKAVLEGLLVRQTLPTLVRLGEWVGLSDSRGILWVEADEAWFEELVSTLKEHGPIDAEERAEEALLSKKVANAGLKLGRFLEDVRALRAFGEDRLQEAQKLRNYGQVASLASWLERLVSVEQAGEEVARLWKVFGESMGLVKVSTWKKEKGSGGKSGKGKGGKGLVGEARRGNATPQTAFRLPILQALLELGGQGRTAEVLERVYAKVRHILKEVDLEPARTDRAYEPLWRNRARWEAARLKREGLLAMGEGLWALTDKGQAYLEAQGDLPPS